MKKPIRYMPVSPAPSSGMVVTFLAMMAILMLLDVVGMVYACVENSR